MKGAGREVGRISVGITPGRWIAVQRDFGYPDYEGGPIIRVWDVYSEAGVPVAIGTIADHNPGNARLIASAPDLLAALEAVEPFLFGLPWGPNEGARETWYLVVGAIAKARGQTNDATPTEKPTV